MVRPRIYADFQNADSRGRVRLNCVGTIRDLATNRIALEEGLELTLSDEELEAEASVRYAEDESLWVAEIDWTAIRKRAD